MTYEIYNAETIWNRKGKPPVVRICPQGHIRFSVEAVKLLGLKKGMCLTFVTNPIDNGTIYFYADTKGLPLTSEVELKTGSRLEVCCRPLTKKLLSFLGFSKNKTFSLTSDTTPIMEGVKAWIICKSKCHTPVKWKRTDKIQELD